jgi:hypothetical protein
MNILNIHHELLSVGIPISATYPAEELSGGGLGIGGEYVVQVSKYEKNNPIILFSLKGNGTISDEASFKNVNDLIQYIMEN